MTDLMQIEECNALKEKVLSLESEILEAVKICNALAARNSVQEAKIAELTEALHASDEQLRVTQHLLAWTNKALVKCHRFTEGLTLRGQKGDYCISDLLGVGSFSVVRRGQAKETTVAVKQVSQDDCEINVLRRMVGEEHVVQLVEAVVSSQKSLMYIVMELGVDLEKALAETPDEVVTQCVFAGVAAGVGSMHRSMIGHLDLKGSNVVLVPNALGQLSAKVCDFGCSMSFEAGRRYSGDVGTPCAQSPELHRKEEWAPCAVDSWALGCLLWFLASKGCYPYGTSDTPESTLSERVIAGIFEDPDVASTFSHNEQRLISLLLVADESKRASALLLATDPWLTSGRQAREEGKSSLEDANDSELLTMQPAKSDASTALPVHSERRQWRRERRSWAIRNAGDRGSSASQWTDAAGRTWRLKAPRLWQDLYGRVWRLKTTSDL